MEAFGEASHHDGSQGLCSDHRTAGPSWAFLHKAIITIIMGSLMFAAGGLLLLLHSSGGNDPSRSVASACLSIGLMFVVVGLVWIPILKEKHRRKRLSQGLE